MVYQTSVDLHKFFLTWRHQLLAGYLATISGLGITFGWTYSSANNARPLTALVCLTGLFLTTFFWLLEYRNRSLYRTCQRIAVEIETTLGFDTDDPPTRGQGVYAALNQTSKRVFTHSRAIDAMFVVASLALIGGAFYSFCYIK